MCIELTCRTTDAYKRASKFTVLPLENTIYGVVTETLDCLICKCDRINYERLNADETKLIVAVLDLPISHCLVVKKGTKIEDIRWVSSHEQVRSSNRLYIVPDVWMTMDEAWD